MRENWSVRFYRFGDHDSKRSRPGLPGAQLTTYRIAGLLLERGNLDPRAGRDEPGRPPSPVMSRTRGGAFVVVGARESRAQGEGRQ